MDEAPGVAVRGRSRRWTVLGDRFEVGELLGAGGNSWVHACKDRLLQNTAAIKILCAARRTFDASLAVDGQPTAQREKFEAERDDRVAHERKQHARCRSVAKRRVQKPNPPLVAHQPRLASDRDGRCLRSRGPLWG